MKRINLKNLTYYFFGKKSTIVRTSFFRSTGIILLALQVGFFGCDNARFKELASLPAEMDNLPSDYEKTSQLNTRSLEAINKSKRDLERFKEVTENEMIKISKQLDEIYGSLMIHSKDIEGNNDKVESLLLQLSTAKESLAHLNNKFPDYDDRLSKIEVELEKIMVIENDKDARISKLENRFKVVANQILYIGSCFVIGVIISFANFYRTKSRL